MLKKKSILVTGGTGGIGKSLIQRLLLEDPKSITIFSRDEFKQFEMKHDLEKHITKLKFVLGDIRDKHALSEAVKGVDYVFHTAALKHVPECEAFPLEAIKTNVLGAANLREVCITHKVKKVVVISTDKAVRSVNVMGMTKALQERIVLSSTYPTGTEFVCVRFGNVIMSRGSVIPLIKKRITENKPLIMTDEHMTRFLISYEEANELVLTALRHGMHGTIYVKKMAVCKIRDLFEVLIESLTGKKEYPITKIGLRQGEQMYESLVSEEEMSRVVEYPKHYVIHPFGMLKESKIITPLEEYRSDLAREILSKEGIKKKLQEAHAL